MPKLENISPQDSGRALSLFPWIGLVIGLSLLITTQILNGILPAQINAALILILWVLITGGLHIDGLADSADGWLAGGDKERTLKIMKDPNCGSAAVMIVALLLIAKYSVLSYLFGQGIYWPLLLAPLLGRAGPLCIFLTTPCGNPTGLAQHFQEHSSKDALKISLACVLLLALFIGGFSGTLTTLAIGGLVLFGLRQLMIKRVGGHTGDTHGACIEITELVVLISLAI